MNAQTLARLCKRFDLGVPAGAARFVPGGLQNRLARVDTDRGAWAAKFLSPAGLALRGRAGFEASEQVAAEAEAGGVSTIAARRATSEQSRVQDLGDGLIVLVYPWVDGETLPATPAAPAPAAQMGAILARLHTLDLPGHGLAPAPAGFFDEDTWRELAERGQQTGALWAANLAAALPDVLVWNRIAREAANALASGHLVGHRDMDQKNVLWRAPTNPLVLDWEQAGRVHPADEVMGAALNWAGVPAGPTPDPVAFAAFLQAYARVAPLRRADLEQAARGVLSKWLIWLEFNLRRSLIPPSDPSHDERTAGYDARRTLNTLRTLFHDTETRLALCRAALPG